MGNDMIPRRDLNLTFDPAAVPRDWVHDNAFQTAFLNALSLLFPEGEKFFVDSVKRMRKRITDPELQEQITGFIGQEAMHGREHRAFNDMLAMHGYVSARRVDKRLKGFLYFVRRILTPKSQLAVTCALEHFTAMLAEQLLGEELVRNELHPSVRPLWLWHALEESEHKAVAFDVYRAVGGGYVRRVAIMLLATFVFFVAQGLAHTRMMADRKILWKPWRWVGGITRMWIYPGYFTRLFPAYLSYFRPGFHPDDRDTRKLLATWRDVLFGNAGALRDRVRMTA
jgi:predicted metal-dependent hydrolase